MENSPARSDRCPRSHCNESTHEDLSFFIRSNLGVSGAKEEVDTKQRIHNANVNQEQESDEMKYRREIPEHSPISPIKLINEANLVLLLSVKTSLE